MNNKEIEIKFGVLGDPENLMQILSSTGTVTGEHIDNLSNTYFDTEDQRLFFCTSWSANSSRQSVY